MLFKSPTVPGHDSQIIKATESSNDSLEMMALSDTDRRSTF